MLTLKNVDPPPNTHIHTYIHTALSTFYVLIVLPKFLKYNDEKNLAGKILNVIVEANKEKTI